MRAYFDADLDWEEYRHVCDALTADAGAFRSEASRAKAVERNESFDDDRIVRYALRPFDMRWCYYTDVGRSGTSRVRRCWAQCWDGKSVLHDACSAASQIAGRAAFCFTGCLGDNDFLSRPRLLLPICGFATANVWTRGATDALRLARRRAGRLAGREPFAAGRAITWRG